MKKEIWGFNVIGPQGLDARNDFAVGPNDEGDDVVLRVNQAELTGKELETLKEIAEGGPTPGGGGFPEQDLDDPTFVPEANHYYKQKAGEKPGPVMTAFIMGQTLSNGDKIHFDTTKGDELGAFLATLPYPEGKPSLSVLDVDHHGFGLWSLKNGEDYIFVVVVNEGESVTPVYATADGEFEVLGLVYTAGFQNLDADNNYIINVDQDDVIDQLYDTTPPTWNGVIAGTLEEAPASKFEDGVVYFYDGEEYHAITGEGGEGTLDYNKLENVPIINLTENKTTVLSPFEVGQALNSESILHIDTNKEEEFLSYLQTLEYPEQIPMAPFMRAKRTADSALIILVASYRDNVYGLAIGRVGEDSKMIYVSQDFYDEETGTQYYKGFQNLDADGNWQLTQLLTPADGDFVIDRIDDTDPSTWNGVIISSAAEGTVVSPTPVDGEFYKRNGQIYKYTAAKPAELGAFEVGQTLAQGSKIHFDTTKGDELAEYLRELEYPTGDMPAVQLFVANGDNRSLVLNAMHRVDGSQEAYMLFIIGLGYGSAVLYIDRDFYDESTNIQYRAGFQNLDDDGNYILSAVNLPFIVTIDQVNDTTPPTWNGIIIGIMGESQPELYDKVVLESELGGGSEAVIIDLGEITEEQGTIDLTEEQYNLIIGNPDVILRAKLNLGGEVVNAYAQKQAGAINNDVEEEVICGVTLQGLNFNCTVKPEGHSDDKYVCKYVTTEEFVGPILYRHDIKISCSAPSVFTVYLTVIYYTDDAVNTLNALGNMLNWRDNYMANGYYNNSSALLPITCINMNTQTVSYLDGMNEQTASFNDSSTMTITDNVTTLAK